MEVVSCGIRRQRLLCSLRLPDHRSAVQSARTQGLLPELLHPRVLRIVPIYLVVLGVLKLWHVVAFHLCWQLCFSLPTAEGYSARRSENMAHSGRSPSRSICTCFGLPVCAGSGSALCTASSWLSSRRASAAPGRRPLQHAYRHPLQDALFARLPSLSCAALDAYPCPSHSFGRFGADRKPDSGGKLHAQPRRRLAQRLPLQPGC